MNRDGLVETLEDAGLSPYQADAYVTLLEMGSGSATDIAEASEVPDPRIYDVLRDLEKQGYVETYEQDSLNARAHSPEDVLADLQRRAERFTDAASEIEQRWEQPSPEQNVVSIVKRYDTVLRQAREAIRSAQDQVQVSVALEDLPEIADALKTALDGGAVVKLSVYTPHGSDVAPDPDQVADICTECRHRAIPSPFVVIVDRSITCFVPHAGSINEYGVLVDDRSHTYVFHWFFLTCLWDIWEPIYGGSDREYQEEYIDLRYCIRDLKPLFEAGREIRVHVEGIHTTSREPDEVEGVVTDLLTTGSETFGIQSGRYPIAAYAGMAGLSIDTGERVFDVGGWGATIEDLEATRITILDVE